MITVLVQVMAEPNKFFVDEGKHYVPVTKSRKGTQYVVFAC